VRQAPEEWIDLLPDPPRRKGRLEHLAQRVGVTDLRDRDPVGELELEPALGGTH